MKIREPVLADAPAMGLVHVRAWQDGYKDGLMPEEFLSELSPDARADMWAEILQRPPRPRFGRWVAEAEDGSVVGHITVGPSEGDDDSEVGEVFSLNVHPDVWGRGFGGALLERGVQALAEAGFPRGILWVHSGNTRARSFYEAKGWASGNDTRTVEVLGVTAPETLYVREPLSTDG